MARLLVDDGDYERLLLSLSEQIMGSRSALNTDLDKFEDEIEEAVIDGLLTEDKRGDYAIVRAEKSLDFASKFKKLTENRRELDLIKQNRLDVLTKDWEELQQRMANAGLDQSGITTIREQVDRAFTAKDTRVVEEDLSRIREALDEGLDPGEYQKTSKFGRDVISDFIGSHAKIEALISRQGGLKEVAINIKEGQNMADMQFAQLLDKRRKEAFEAIETWRRIKQVGASTSIRPQQFAKILSYLGFTFDITADKTISVQNNGSNWIHLRVSMSARDLARPIPQFGSERRGNYDVLCFWDRLSAKNISSTLTALKTSADAVLILY